MIKFFAAHHQSKQVSFALLILRLVCGLAFMFHGWSKIQNPLGWMGPEAAIPGFFQLLAAVSEFGGGLAWILGVLTPMASLGIGCTMTVAVYTMVMKGAPFVGQGASYELAFVYLCVALLLLSAGPGLLSADRKIFGEK